MSTAQTVVNKAEKAIKSALSGSAALAALVSTRIYRDKAPREADTPLVIFAYQDGTLERVVGGARFDSPLTFAVRAVVEVPSTTADLADTIAATFDAVLEGYSSATYGVVTITAEAPIVRAYTETDEAGRGKQYEERGFTYRVLMQGG